MNMLTEAKIEALDKNQQNPLKHGNKFNIYRIYPMDLHNS